MELQTLLTGFLAVIVVYVIQRWIYVYHRLTHVPTVGPAGFLSTYVAIFRYLKDAKSVLSEGYSKYHGHLFKVYTHEGWTVCCSGEAMLADVKKATDQQLSFIDSVNDVLQVQYTIDPVVAQDHYHVAIIRSALTKNIVTKFPDVLEEVHLATEENIPETTEWQELTVLPTIMKIISRASNRLFVGVPLCRNQEYLDINVNYTIQVVTGAFILRLFPQALRSIVAKLFLRTHSTYKRTRKIVEPMLQYRLDQDEKYGKKWEGRPNDFVSWLLDIAEGTHRTIKDLTLRILAINFAAIHTSSMSATHAVFDLASNPQCIEPLREEIETVVKEQGWSKVSLGQMRKLDSLVKESQRVWGLGLVSSTRRVLQDFTFSNGETVPAGEEITFLSNSVHMDEAYYPDAKEFRPFRFSDLREAEGEGVFHQFVTPDATYIPFGIPSRHSCPGRFFASTEIKQVLAHLILTYDLKIEGDVRPTNLAIGVNLSPDPNGKVMFRKRASKENQ